MSSRFVEKVEQNFPQSPQILSGSKFADFNGGIEGEGDSNYSLAVTWPFTRTCTHLHKIIPFHLALYTSAQQLHAQGTHRKASSPHHQIGFGFVSDGVKLKKATNTETAPMRRTNWAYAGNGSVHFDHLRVHLLPTPEFHQS